VLGGMNRGGLETWLMHVLRNIDRDTYRMDFLVHTDRECPYDAEVQSLGSRLYHCPYAKNPLRYARRFREILKDHGPYQVIHSHPHHFSGIVLKLAHAAGVPIRIAHSHNDTQRVDQRAGAFRRAYLTACKHWIQTHATHRIGASQRSADSLFGSADARKSPLVLHYGIDMAPFFKSPDRLSVRRALGLASSNHVIGHVGRFEPQKNHRFLMDVACQAMAGDSDVRLLLIGVGPLKAEMERYAAALGIADRVIFAGGRADVPELMLAAMDVFVLPSWYEGFPLVLLEAQCAGLPVLTSTEVCPEVAWRPELTRRLSLSAAAPWSRAILDLKHVRGIPAMSGCPSDVSQNIRVLERIYMPEASGPESL
jgi:glycosyltransferase involved in cell wall biosynthesis